MIAMNCAEYLMLNNRAHYIIIYSTICGSHAHIYHVNILQYMCIISFVIDTETYRCGDCQANLIQIELHTRRP